MRKNVISFLGQGSLWIAFERATASLLNILSILAIARFLGVVDYGNYAFAMSLVGVGLAFGHLGLDGLLIKKILSGAHRVEALIGSVSFAKYTIYLPIFFMAVFSRHIYDLGPSASQLLRNLSVIFLILPLTSSVLSWLNSQSLFRESSWMRVLAIFCGTTAKLALIALGFGVLEVGLAHSGLFLIELVLLLFLVYRIGGPMPIRWRVDFALLKGLISEALPLFMASLFAMAYANIDVISLRIMTDAERVGEYALIPQTLQSAQIIPFAITLAAFPSLVRKIDESLPEFLEKSGALAGKLVVISLPIAGALVLFAPSIVPALFGAPYEVTGSMLQLAAAALPFIFLRQLTTKLYICLEKGWLLALIEFLGLCTALGLNLLLIPRYGGFGCAIAMVATYMLTSVIALFASGVMHSIYRSAKASI